MVRGFFSDDALERIKQRAVTLSGPRCDICGLHRTCLSPYMPVGGLGKSDVLVVAEAPGREEDKQNTQLVGESGRLLRKILSEIGVDMHRDCWRTNTLICRPPLNRTPTEEEIGYCRPNLLQTIVEYRPRVIILLGKTAVEAVLGWILGERIASLSRWVGWTIPYMPWRAWLCPVYHPAHLLRNQQDKGMYRVTQLHLERAFGLREGPAVVDYSKQIRLIGESERVAKILDKITESRCEIAFDYETNMLKPDSRDARIYSCAVCWEGKRTIAFPWTGEAIQAMSRLLRAKHVVKFGQNLKFEDRWTRSILGHPVARWGWDTMQAAHILDNRPGVSGLKFQAFVRLGILPYEKETAPYLDAIETGGKNRIEKIPPTTLLRYNAMDALVTFLLAKQQMKEIMPHDGDGIE